MDIRIITSPRSPHNVSVIHRVACDRCPSTFSVDAYYDHPHILHARANDGCRTDPAGPVCAGMSEALRRVFLHLCIAHSNHVEIRRLAVEVAYEQGDR